MVRWLIAATFVASAGMIFAPAAAYADTSAVSGPLCEQVSGTGTVTFSVPQVCLPWPGKFECSFGTTDVLNLEWISDEVCLPSA